MHQSQRFWIFFSQMMSWGLYIKNDISQKFWVHFKSVMVCGLRENLVDWGRDLSEYPRKLCTNTRIRFQATHSLFLTFSWRKQYPNRILINWRKKHRNRNKVKTNKDAETRFQGRIRFIVAKSAITYSPRKLIMIQACHRHWTVLFVNLSYPSPGWIRRRGILKVYVLVHISKTSEVRNSSTEIFVMFVEERTNWWV